MELLLLVAALVSNSYDFYYYYYCTSNYQIDYYVVETGGIDCRFNMKVGLAVWFDVEVATVCAF